MAHTKKQQQDQEKKRRAQMSSQQLAQELLEQKLAKRNASAPKEESPSKTSVKNAAPIVEEQINTKRREPSPLKEVTVSESSDEDMDVKDIIGAINSNAPDSNVANSNIPASSQATSQSQRSRSLTSIVTAPATKRTYQQSYAPGSLFAMIQNQTTLVQPIQFKKVVTVDEEKCMFFGWFNIYPERTAADLQTYIGSFPRKTAMVNAKEVEEKSGSLLVNNCVFRRDFDPTYWQTFYFYPACVFRTPFSFGSFRDGNILSQDGSPKELTFLADMLISQYHVRIKANMTQVMEKGYHRLIFGKPANKETKALAEVKEAGKFDVQGSQPHCLVYKKPFKGSPYDVLLTSCTVNYEEFYAKVKVDSETRIAKINGSTSIVMNEAITEATLIYSEFRNLLNTEFQYYSDKPRAEKWLETKRLYIKSRFEAVCKNWKAIFTAFIDEYDGLPIPADFVNCAGLTDLKDQQNFIKLLSLCVRVTKQDLTLPVQIVHLESVTAGDYCSLALQGTFDQRLHGDMTGGFNGFTFTYLILGASHKVISFKSSSSMKVPYSSGDSVKANAAKLAVMFGCPEALDKPFQLDESHLSLSTQNPEHAILQAITHADNFYKYQESCFTSRLVARSFDHQGHELGNDMFRDKSWLFEKWNTQESTMKQFQTMVDDSLYQGPSASFSADNFFFVLSKYTNHLRPAVFSTLVVPKVQANADGTIPEHCFPTVGTAFQKFNWIQVHRHYTYLSSRKNDSALISSSNIKVDLGQEEIDTVAALDFPRLINIFEDAEIDDMYEDLLQERAEAKMDGKASDEEVAQR